MGHNNNMYDFCGEISEILPNTLSKVAPKKGHFCMENGEISPIYEPLLVKYINLITLLEIKYINLITLLGIVGKQACSL